MKKYILTIDLGGTYLLSALFNKYGVLEDKSIVETHKNKYLNNETQLFSIESFFSIISEKIVNTSIVGIAISIPGIVDESTNIIGEIVNVKNNISGVNLKKEIEEKFSIPTIVLNDANSYAISESFSGNGKNYSNVFFINIGTGIGGGLIIDGKLYWGSQGKAGEIGHTTIDTNGAQCKCGNRGCLEMYVSGQKIQQVTKNHTLEIPKTIFKILGLGFCNIVNLYDPDVLIIGGGVALKTKNFIEKIFSSSDTHVINKLQKIKKISLAKHGIDGALLGNAIYLENYIKNSTESPLF